MEYLPNLLEELDLVSSLVIRGRRQSLHHPIISKYQRRDRRDLPNLQMPAIARAGDDQDYPQYLQFHQIRPQYPQFHQIHPQHPQFHQIHQSHPRLYLHPSIS
jgi:hypothetical protein